MRRVAGRLRVVFDANICVQAIAFDDGPAAKAFRGVEARLFRLFVSRATLRELHLVLNYDDVRAISPNMTESRMKSFLQRLQFHSTLLRDVPRAFEFRRDPRDEPYLDLAAAAKADYLVSRDKDLLSLMTGHSPFCKRFRRKTHPLRVVDPAEFLKAIEQRRD